MHAGGSKSGLVVGSLITVELFEHLLSPQEGHWAGEDARVEGSWLGDASCDLIELRLDHLFHDGECSSPLALKRDLPYLMTARDPREGGANSLTFSQRSGLLHSFLPWADFIDVEAQNVDEFAKLIAAAKERGVKVILSHHDFHQTPSIGFCEGIIESAIAAGADIVKLAFAVDSLTDVQLGVDLLNLGVSAPLSVMGMGDLAPISRLLYAQCGSALNYGYLGEVEAAPGQWPAHLLKTAIGHLPKLEP